MADEKNLAAGDGQSLVDHLANSGTGQNKLAPALAVLKADAKASAMAVFATLANCGEVTLAKARKFLGLPAPTAGPVAVRPEFPVRAPVGGVKVGGVLYSAGQTIPAAVVAGASVAEVKAILTDVLPIGQPIQMPPVTPAAASEPITPADPGPPSPDAAPATDGNGGKGRKK